MAVRYFPVYYQTLKNFLLCLCLSMIIFLSISLTIQNRSSLSKNDFDQVSTYALQQTHFYPHLPIQIYTNNREKFLQLKNKTKKLILLANPMFGSATWSMKSVINGSNSGNMSELYCSFLNSYCEITNDLQRFPQANAVVYHLRDYVNRSQSIFRHRHPSQRFVFTLWEPPRNTPDLRSYRKFFNWTMTYRFDSHIFASYYPSTAYRLRDNVWLPNAVEDYQVTEEQRMLHENIPMEKKRRTAAALISNCGPRSQQRWSLVQELQKNIDVTVYGKCGQPCPTIIVDGKTIECRTYLAENYYFLLVFENSFCQDYTTEKFFSTLQLPIIPVVHGLTNYSRWIPPSGFIDVQDYSSISMLTDHLEKIKSNYTLYQSYFQWKKDFVWGGFSTYMTPFCDLCLRLHLDSTAHVIDNIHSWWFDQTCPMEKIKEYFTD